MPRRKSGFSRIGAYYTQGACDFVTIVDVKDVEAVLGFSLWYAAQGFGRIQTLPAFDNATIERAIGKA